MDSIGILARCRLVTLFRPTDRTGLTDRAGLAIGICLTLLGLTLVSGCGSEPSPSHTPSVSQDQVTASDLDSGSKQVADSVAEAEYAEVLAKSQILRKALAIAEQGL